MFSDDVNTATPIRFASTANLNINSSDRLSTIGTTETATNFLISQNQSILNGYFTRLAIVEMVLNWGIPNISTINDNNTLIVEIGDNSVNVELDTGFYTVSSVMREIVVQLNAGFSGIAVFSFDGQQGSKALSSTVDFTIVDGNLANQLSMVTGTLQSSDLIISPYLMPTNLKYLDFVSPQLSYQQGLKDASTSKISRDVLYRWNFGWDSPPQIDADGYAIQQGYMAFTQRRYLSFPKQIKWTGTQPLGNLSFQVYNSDGDIFYYDAFKYDMIWSMNILVSEQ